MLNNEISLINSRRHVETLNIKQEIHAYSSEKETAVETLRFSVRTSKLLVKNNPTCNEGQGNVPKGLNIA